MSDQAVINLIPLVSPYTDDGSSLSEIRISRLIRKWTNLGAEGFFVGGDSGEFLSLSSGERKYMVETVLRDSFSALPVVVNISSLSTSKCLDLAQHAGRHGARAGFLTPPYYGCYSDTEIANHIRTVVNLSNLTVILGDPNGAITPKVEDLLRDVPRLIRADMTGWDDWSTPEYAISTVKTLAAIFEEAPTPQMKMLIDRYSAAAVMKAAYERSGLDLGYPRSPRASVAGSDLGSLLMQAA